MGLATRGKDLAALTLDQLPRQVFSVEDTDSAKATRRSSHSRTPWTKQSQELPHRSAEEGTCFRLQGVLHG